MGRVQSRKAGEVVTTRGGVVREPLEQRPIEKEDTQENISENVTSAKSLMS